MEAINLASHKAQAKSLRLQEELRQDQKQNNSTLASIKDVLQLLNPPDLVEMALTEQSRLRDGKKFRLLDAFSTYNYMATWNLMRKERTPGTSEWVFETDAFRSWKTGVLKRICCCGRCESFEFIVPLSMLTLDNSGLWKIGHQVCSRIPHKRQKLICQSASIVAQMIKNKSGEDIIENTSHEDVIAFFFCRYDHEESLRARTIVGTIARQLAKEIPSSSFSDFEEDDRELAAIIPFLISNLNKSRRYFIILDGLDECDQKEAIEAIDMITNLSASPLYIRFYLSTRPTTLTWLPSNFHPEEIINMEDQTHHKNLARDITRYIEMNLQLKNREMEPAILRKLQEGAEGM